MFGNPLTRLILLRMVEPESYGKKLVVVGHNILCRSNHGTLADDQLVCVGLMMP